MSSQTYPHTNVTDAARPSVAPGRKPYARYLVTAGRVLLGLVFFVFGLNGFLNFIPPPTEPMPEASVALAGAFLKSGYLFPLIKGTEVLGGALLLGNRFVPLALALLAPVVVNIFAFHAFLAPSGLGMSIVIVLVEAGLAWAYRDAYRPMLAMRVTPRAS